MSSSESTGEKKLAALMFTDIVGSVDLQRRMGTDPYTRFVRRHDSIFKQCLELAGETSILNETGDGFLVRFSDPSDAVRTALRLQYALRNEVIEGEALQMRIGLNLGMVTEMDDGLRGEKRVVGMAINLAARFMDLGKAGQILLTRAIYDDARQFVREHPSDLNSSDGGLPELKWVSHGGYLFQGTDEPLEVFEVGAVGVAPLRAPDGGSKARPTGGTAFIHADPEETRQADTPKKVKESDVYINFAAVDDRPLTPGQAGWISQFQRNLETRIEQLSGEAVKVSQRPEVDEGAGAMDLLKVVSDVKAMVSVVSPPFLKSKPCVREAETFWSKAVDSGNLWLDERTRLLKVVKTPVADSDVPESLNRVFSDLLSFDFYTVDPDTGRTSEFDETFGVDARRKYYERVYDLAYELCHVLRAFQSGEASKESRAQGKTIYLAETTGDLHSARDRLRRELLERGHVVLPEKPLPLSGPTMEASVKDCLERADFSVHLVGSVYGMIPESAQHSVVELQNRIASEQSRIRGDALARLIWLPRDRSEVEVRQQDFIRQLEEDTELLTGADLIEGALEEFKEILIEAVTPKEVPAEETSVVADAGSNSARQIYLICDRSDEESIEPLEDYLFDQGFEVTTPNFEGSEGDVATAHRQRLLHCDAALIYYGAGSKGWVETKLMDLQQAPGYGRTKPMLAQIVYLAAPFDRRKERFRTHHAQVVKAPESWNPELLTSFVSDLKSE